MIGQKDKQIERLKSKPRDFTFDDTETFLDAFSIAVQTKAKPAAHGLCLSQTAMRQSCCINHIPEKNYKDIK